MTGRPAAFLDRDGTIIRETNYIRNPADVEVLPGVAAALRELNERGVAVIVVTNQSGIARGMLTARVSSITSNVPSGDTSAAGRAFPSHSR